MKINLTAWELWFCRVSVIILLIWAVSMSITNKQQWKLIFKSIDIAETATKQISSNTQAINQLSESVQINQEAIINILQNQ